MLKPSHIGRSWYPTHFAPLCESPVQQNISTLFSSHINNQMIFNIRAILWEWPWARWGCYSYYITLTLTLTLSSTQGKFLQSDIIIIDYFDFDIVPELKIPSLFVSGSCDIIVQRNINPEQIRFAFAFCLRGEPKFTTRVISRIFCSNKWKSGVDLFTFQVHPSPLHAVEHVSILIVCATVSHEVVLVKLLVSEGFELWNTLARSCWIQAMQAFVVVLNFFR